MLRAFNWFVAWARFLLIFLLLQKKSFGSQAHVPLSCPEVVMCVEIYHNNNISKKVWIFFVNYLYVVGFALCLNCKTSDFIVFLESAYSIWSERICSICIINFPSWSAIAFASSTCILPQVEKISRRNFSLSLLLSLLFHVLGEFDALLVGWINSGPSVATAKGRNLHHSCNDAALG